ncbi:MAG: hypothetical protein R2720_09355 [Candidatus Nanopelagicales bacterium]
MARIDPLVRSQVIASLQMILDREGTVGWATIRRMGDLYGIPVHTVYRWSRRLGQGDDPTVDGRRTTGDPEGLPDEVLRLLAHNPTLRAAHKAAVAQGVYAGSYRQFVRDVDRLSPALRAGLADGKDALIRLLPTMAYPLVGRNETWVLDHTQSDVRCVVPRGSHLVRPWVSILKDKGTRVVVAIGVSADRTRATDVVGLMAAAMLQQTGLGGNVPVGGRPESVLCDNGGENVSDQIVQGMAMLGVAMLPTTPGHSWQNGSAENIIRLFQQQCEATLPGYVKGGSAVDGGLRFTENTYEQEDKDRLLTVEALQARAVQWAIGYNATPGADGLSPLQRWEESDGTDIVGVGDEEVALAMTTASHKHAVTKNGIYFRNREYQAAFTADYVGRGKVLTVRFLPGVTDWIDCYYDDRRVGRAYLKASLPRSEQAAIIRARQTMTAKVRNAERESVRVRQAEALGDTADNQVPAGERREPHRNKTRKKHRAEFGGGATSEREAEQMRKNQALVVEMFGHILDEPLNDGGAE